MQKTAKPPRIPWNNFPNVFIHANESAVKQHLAYRAAKSGDDEAATDVVLSNLNVPQVVALSDMLGDKMPTLVSAHALERDGVNAIPEVFANELALMLTWPVDSAIVQVNVVSHTGADGFGRLARQAEFEGAVKQGCEYVLVDDFVGMGGTLANLRGYIESKGGKVLAAVWLTGKPHSAKLALSPERLNELRNKHGTELENWWSERFAHGLNTLTESEARYLVRTDTIGTIRHRIAEAEQAGNS
jgi:hypothetical protein